MAPASASFVHRRPLSVGGRVGKLGSADSGARRIRRLLPLWTLREIRVQYRQSALDVGWTLLTPVITLAGYGFVLTRAFNVDGDGVPYLTFAWTGVVVWTFVANALARGALSLVASADLVRKVSFPHEVVPIATVFAAGLDLVIGMGVLAVLMAIQGITPNVTLAAVVPVFAVLFVVVIASSVIFATVTAFVRDLAHGLNVFLRIGIFVTPVMYPVSVVPARYEWALQVNTITVLIEATRDSVLRGRWPNWGLLGVHAAFWTGMLAFARWYVRRVGGRIADVI